MGDQVKLEIIVDEKNGTLIVKNFRAGLAGIPKEAEGAESAIGKLWKGMAIGDLVASGIKTSYSAFVGILKSSATEYMQAEAGNAALRQTLVNLGDATEGTFNQLDAYAEKIQATTVVDDDMAKSLMQLGLNMGIPIKQIGGATEAAIGLTKAFKGMSLDTAMKATAAAFEGNTQKLQRYIPELKETATQSEKLAIVQKAMADGLKIAHNEITTGQGKLAQFKNDWGDLQKVIGKVLVEAVMPLIGGFKDFFNQNKDLIVGMVKSLVTGFSTLIDVAKGVLGAFRDVLSFVQNLSPVISAIVQGWKNLLVLFTDDLGSTYDKLGESINREAEMQKKSIDRFREAAKAVGATKDEIHQLILKYKDVEDAGIKHERMLRDLIKTHPELKEKLKEHAAQTKVNTQVTNDFTLGLNRQAASLRDYKALLAQMPQPTKDFTAAFPPLVKVTGEYISHAEMARDAIYDLKQEIKGGSDTVEDWTFTWGEARAALGDIRSSLADIGVELSPLGESFLNVADSAMGFIDALASGNPLAMIAAGFQLVCDVVSFLGDLFSTELSPAALAAANAFSSVNIQIALMAVEFVKLHGPATASMDEITDAARRMADEFDRVGAAVRRVQDALANAGFSNSATNPGTGTSPVLDHGRYAPDIYAASGFYSSALPTDMLIQAHKGEPVGIGMAAMGAFFSPRTGRDTVEEATPAGGGYLAPRSGSDSKTTIVVEDHSVWSIQVDPKSGIDQNALCEALNIAVKDNRQQVADKIAEAVARKL